MNFFIKKDSNFPELQYPLIQKILEQYNITANMFDDVAVTFSMIDADSGLFRIANVPAELKIEKLRPQNLIEFSYTLVYKFKLHQTRKTGRFQGEFKIDFLNNDSCNLKLTLPIDDTINIIISDSITKTSVI